mmetsp:Transcript_77446/g.167500  ORF Transcript_77446/g.167500 Transcript_77446/m.167500 type:complete len:218 (-) Transcript_77446:381-1034(-)
MFFRLLSKVLSRMTLSASSSFSSSLKRPSSILPCTLVCSLSILRPSLVFFCERSDFNVRLTCMALSSSLSMRPSFIIFSACFSMILSFKPLEVILAFAFSLMEDSISMPLNVLMIISLNLDSNLLTRAGSSLFSDISNTGLTKGYFISLIVSLNSLTFLFECYMLEVKIAFTSSILNRSFCVNSRAFYLSTVSFITSFISSTLFSRLLLFMKVERFY